jgi:hypothetical protein
MTAIEIRPVSGMDDLERWVALHNEIGPDNPATAGCSTEDSASPRRAARSSCMARS